VHVFNVGDVLAANDLNTWCVPLAGLKSANQIVSSTTTLINDADMRFAVAANWSTVPRPPRYASPTGADWKSSFTVPASAHAQFNAMGNNLSGGVRDITLEWLDTDSVTSQGKGAAILMIAEFFGFVSTAGTAGNLIFQWAPNTSNAGNTTLFANSYLTGRRIS
jgi:hypothetical protein